MGNTNTQADLLGLNMSIVPSHEPVCQIINLVSQIYSLGFKSKTPPQGKSEGRITLTMVVQRYCPSIYRCAKKILTLTPAFRIFFFIFGHNPKFSSFRPGSWLFIDAKYVCQIQIPHQIEPKDRVKNHTQCPGRKKEGKIKHSRHLDFVIVLRGAIFDQVLDLLSVKFPFLNGIFLVRTQNLHQPWASLKRANTRWIILWVHFLFKFVYISRFSDILS